MVGFGASLVTGKISLLPSTRTQEALNQIQTAYPGSFCLHDGEGLGALCAQPFDAAAPHIRLFEFPAHDAEGCIRAGSEPPPMPYIPSDQTAACVFTSGTTGMPQPHTKVWHRLVASAQAEATHLGLNDEAWSLVGTVPSQHMYGLESLILLALHGGASVWTGRPFYPADICSAVQQMPAPRMLVTTPVHLRALLTSPMPGPEAYPSVAKLLSATSPLPQELALRAEQTLNAPVFEIYGSTETGQIATRHSTQSAAWTLFPGVVLEALDGVTWAHGGHVQQATPLADVVDIRDPTHFVLIGRNSDLINIAGKRSSLAYLTHKLLAVAGVLDGCMFVPESTTVPGAAGAMALPDSTRLCAIVAAPQLTAAQLLEALRRSIDPVFLPRPILLVDSLPRNPTGKIPKDALQEIFRQHPRRSRSTRNDTP